MPRQLPALVVAILVGACSHDGGVSGSGRLKVFTQNMDEGMYYSELAAAKTPVEFAAAVTKTYQRIVATKPEERAAAIAREIEAADPDVVALQEASILRTGPAPASTVKSDLLQSLLAELSKRGLKYTLVSVLPGLDAEAPSTLGFDVRLTSQDAVLVRAEPQLAWSNAQAVHYKTLLAFPTAVGSIPSPRGYISFDGNLNGHGFRFVTTHLEVEAHAQLAQANELVAAQANSTLPLAMAGDFNTSANDASDPSHPTYDALAAAGFADAWTAVRDQEPGPTCCEAPDLTNAAPALSQRIDLVVVRGGITVGSIDRLGASTADRTASGLWPSDHAGLAAVLEIP